MPVRGFTTRGGDRGSCSPSVIVAVDPLLDVLGSPDSVVRLEVEPERAVLNPPDGSGKSDVKSPAKMELGGGGTVRLLL